MPHSDPLRRLQHAARLAAEHVAPGERAGRVVVFDARGARVLDVLVPASAPAPHEPPDAPAAGWVVMDRAATFDGTPVQLSGRRLDVLRVLVENETATVDDLRTAWDGYQAEESTIRWQVGELRKALKKLFGDFPGELIESTGAGYRLLLR